MLKAKYEKYTLNFKRPSGTSRGIMTHKESWFIHIFDSENTEKIGIGECGLLKGLSIDDTPQYESKLQEVCQNIEKYALDFNQSLVDFPSIRMGIEMALLNLNNDKKLVYFENDFTRGKKGIPINGLIWMGEPAFMKSQIEEKLKAGYKCIKMKIGAIDFENEYEILKNLRKKYASDIIEIRVDANGAFSRKDAMDKLEKLAKLDIHSIEQPIKAGQWDFMAQLCAFTPLPIALDEELIGVNNFETKQSLLQTIKPQYIILKPSLLGGFKACDEWISLAEKMDIDWWATSALESNIGLDAIAQWTATKQTNMYQGLGTGQLYTNNIDSTLEIEKGMLFR
jgi:o-succinylbenzoate synthase